MFEPFGAVESSNVIKDPTGKSQGYGFIMFREKDIVEKAIQSMNGLLIGSNIIKVNYVTSGNSCQLTQQSNATGGFQSTGTHKLPVMPTVDLDHMDDNDGLKINANNRIILMQKLASSANIDLSSSQIPNLSVQTHSQQQQKQHSNTKFR
jgi:RNA-binding protein 39